ncbi:hypothetical protein CYPRO_1244 [Cyclonatronum proteinivorum]|uniref:DUF3820 family protein n=1 Tax=Cyclonatronum proteinivorum TaxID=1457365 RepID=A0A345UJ55_9BACT|nr:DUF3820 family protein [Cyclonatronum proteinivorum]AXJ00507.1 hypothetical protein CYPRO_1244 [Cyclonatronum proteinivorum]
MELHPDPRFLIDLVNARMPYGRFEGSWLTDLPVFYLEWFERQGWPSGKLGQQLATMYEIKINGLTRLLPPLIREHRQSSSGD